MNSRSNASLYPHEWFAISVYLSIFIFIALISWLNGGLESLEVLSKESVEQTLSVYISGAVKKPGCYRLGRGSTLGEALSLAEPLDNADTRNLNLDGNLSDEQRIKVKGVKKIPIEVIYKSRGLKKDIVWVKVKSRFEELKNEIYLEDGEVIFFPKRRKIVRENDQIIVERKSGL